MIGRRAQGQGPDRRANTVEQQVAPRGIAGQADGHRHHGAQAIDETEAQHPDIGMAADMLQCAVAHGLPARFAREDLAPVATAHEIPELVTGIAAEERHHHDQADVHVSPEREESCKYQDGLAFEEGA
ncbi:hypothetical protein A6E19_19025 [Pseudomonas putida]|nr:hypothetical protein A6E23_11645 [Pseudomonas putida]OCT30591.1 hypothetical protein A6E24_04425 [Pseudomonas putida]OCT33245.1 hypothetical protein A6E20_23845 [Pseudomonas putida]OCT37110.1 hypothetical protein A6E19_19025 [Pseudomonas putida]